MSNWVKFSDRMPEDSDLNHEGEVVIRDQYGTLTTADIPWIEEDFASRSIHYRGCFWLENLPPLPKTRTIEDVAAELVNCVNIGDGLAEIATELIEEMREILERKDNE